MQLTFAPTEARFAEWFFEHRQDPINQRHNPLMDQDVAALRERLANGTSDWSKFDSVTELRWFMLNGAEVAGTVSLQNINKNMLTAEIGYGISTSMRGQGLATEAVRWLTSTAFAKTPLRRLVAFVHDQNVASRRVLEKLGYKEEGLLREHFLIRGQPANEVVYGILRGEMR